MKLKFAIIMVVLSMGIFIFNGQTFAQSQEVKVEAVRVGNAICPISKEAVDSEGTITEYEYEGKIYSFCCKACVKDFEKDPQKYIERINEAMSGE